MTFVEVAPVLLAAGGGLTAGLRWLAGKLDQIGEHLERQDKATAKVSERVARLEGPIRTVEREVTNGGS